MNRFRLICERQQEEAAERAYRAATDPDYKAVEFTMPNCIAPPLPDDVKITNV